MTRIAVGAPVADRAWVLPQWIEAVTSQSYVCELEMFCVYTPSRDNTADILFNTDAMHVLCAEAESREPYRIRDHAWSEPEWEQMAWLRNQLVAWVTDWEPDYFFSLDTDILIPPNTIATLVETLTNVGADAIAPLVDMERDRRHNQVAWNFMRWDEKGYADRKPWQGANPVPTQPFRIDVICAAMFMNRRAMKARWSKHDGGEDIGWAHHADELDLVRYVEPRITCPHLMRPA